MLHDRSRTDPETGWLWAGGLAALAILLVLVAPHFRSVRPSPPIERETGSEFDARAREWNLRRFADPATGRIPVLTREGERGTIDAISKSPGSALRSASPWTSRGPFDVGGRMRAIAVDVSNEQVLIAAAATGGIWRSEDAGATWVQALRRDQLHTLSSLAQDTRPGRTQVWYAGTGELVGSGSGVGNGIYKSTDGGRTWSLLPSTTANGDFGYVHDVAIDPSNFAQDEVYAATETGVMRSLDGGATWTPVLSTYSSFNDVAVGPDGVVWAATGFLSETHPIAALLRSTDGSTWTDITPASWPSATPAVAIGVAPSRPGEVHFFTQTDNVNRLWKYTYLSGNGSGAGGAWVDRSSQLPGWLTTYGGYCQVLAVRPGDANDVFVGGTSICEWDPMTQRFEYIGAQPSHADHHAYAFAAADPRVMYLATDGGVFRSTGRFQFTDLNHGLVTTQFYGAGANPAVPGDDAIAAGTQDNWSYYAPSGGAATAVFGPTYGSDGGFSAVLPDGDHILVSTPSYVGLHDLRTGAESAAVPPGPNGVQVFINPFAMDPASPYTMYYPSGGGLWRTLDVRAPDWVRLTGTVLRNESVTALGVSSASPAHRVYYGLQGLVARVDDALGPAPVAVEITPPTVRSTFGYVSSISVDPENGDRVLVTISNYNVKSIFYSVDAGVTWTVVGGNLDATPGQVPGYAGPGVLASAILPTASGGRVYFAGTTIGLFSTTALNGTATVWTPEAATDIGNVEINQVQVRASDGLVVVATHGAGLYSTYYWGRPLAVPSQPRPDLRLACRPVPARGAITLSFTLARESEIKLDVVDLSGRRVAVLAGGRAGAGTHDVRWDSSVLAPGVYFGRLRTPGGTVTSRLIVER